MVLLDVLDPSMPAVMERRRYQGESAPLSPRFGATEGGNPARAVLSRDGTIASGPASGAAPANSLLPSQGGRQEAPSGSQVPF